MQVITSAGRGDRQGRKLIQVEKRGESPRFRCCPVLKPRCWETRAVLQTRQRREQTRSAFGRLRLLHAPDLLLKGSNSSLHGEERMDFIRRDCSLLQLCFVGDGSKGQGRTPVYPVLTVMGRWVLLLVAWHILLLWWGRSLFPVQKDWKELLASMGGKTGGGR